MLMAIDPSLNETGICIFNSQNELIYKGIISNTDKLKDMQRLFYIKNELKKLIKKYKINLVGIEDYSYGSKGRAIINLGELGGVIRLYLFEQKIPYILIQPTKIKKFITGKGNAKKELMLLKVYKKFNMEFENNNICDAYALGRYIIKTKSDKNGKKEN